jgi:hypothetical protein
MNRKLVTLLVSGIIIAGSATTAGAHHRDGHTANYFGLCTALANNGNGQGSHNGQAFKELEDEMEAAEDEGRDFCEDVLADGPGNGGGSQNGNGRGGR